MNKHTPTPWNICDSTPSMIEAGDEIIAQSLDVDADVGRQIKWANAAYIVRCVNSHEALVEYYRAAESFAFTSGHEDATVEQERAAEERFERAGDAVRKLMREGLLAAAGAPQ